MSNADTLRLTLPEALAREVRRAIEKGDFETPDDVVATALRVWIERGSPPPMTEARLRELIAEADNSGEEDGDFDIDALIAEARASMPVKS
jgi:Arc/MetJ-type ribon-helix-helix transcriptional regulator